MPVLTEADGKGGLQAKQDHKKDEQGKTGKTLEHIPADKGPGPVIPTEMPEKANNTELEQRFKELNQDEPQK